MDRDVHDALTVIGLDPGQIEDFARGKVVVYSLPTQGDPGIAVIHQVGSRLRSGVIEINVPGGGYQSFSRFRTRSFAVAKAIGASELELFGAAVINPKLESLLMRQGFRRLEDVVPDELGGGPMEILSKIFSPGELQP